MKDVRLSLSMTVRACGMPTRHLSPPATIPLGRHMSVSTPEPGFARPLPSLTKKLQSERSIPGSAIPHHTHHPSRLSAGYHARGVSVRRS